MLIKIAYFKNYKKQDIVLKMEFFLKNGQAVLDMVQYRVKLFNIIIIIKLIFIFYKGN